MYKKWSLIFSIIIILMVGLFIFTACNPPVTDDPNTDDPPIELEVPVEDIESIALKEGSFASIFKIGEILDLSQAVLLITLKPSEEDEGGEEDIPIIVPIPITKDMVKDFATTEVGFAAMRIVYAPEFEISHDYEVIQSTTFFITYELDGGEFSPLYDVEENLIPVPLRFDSIEGLDELREPQKNYYEFEGWYTDPEFKENSKTTQLIVGLNEDIELFAKWNPVVYTITFVTDPFSAYITDKTIKDIKFNIESGIIDLPLIDTDKLEDDDGDGPKSMAFAGWFDSPSSSARRLTHTANPPKNTIYYAKWEPKVSISLNDGFEKRYQKGALASAIKTASLTVKDYYGQVLNNKLNVTAAMISNFDSSEVGIYNMTIKYKHGTIDYLIEVEYEIVGSTFYFITYFANGGTLPQDAPDRYDTLEGVSELPIPTKTAYDFTGWFTDGKLTPNKRKDSIAIGEKASLILYAGWTPTQYSVEYYIDPNNAFPYEDSYNITKSINLWQEGERTGYHFMGWYDNKTLQGEAVTSIALDNYGDKKFYAKWGAKVTSVAITSVREFNIKQEFLQLTAKVLPDGKDPAVFPEVTYKVISDTATGVQVTELNGDKIIADGKFIAEKAGYVVVQAFADGIASEKVTIKVIVEDVQVIKILNSPLVVFPGDTETLIELEFEPFTAKPIKSLIKYKVIDTVNPEHVGYLDDIEITSDGRITVQEGHSDFAFIVRVTYGEGPNTVSKEVIFNVPKSIKTKEDLIAIKTNLEGYYALTADIDLEGESWEPIGYIEKEGEIINYDNAFRGMFFGGADANNEGKPYIIKNLTINADQVTYITAGLFGAIDNAHIEGVILQNLIITGECAENTDYIGGIAGVNRLSIIKNCAVTGEINISGGKYIGGMIGQQYGSMKNVKTLIDENNLTITVESDRPNLSVGGLVGIFIGGEINNAKVECVITVNGCNSAKVGGISGDSKDKIINSEVIVKLTVNELEGKTGNIIYVGGVAGETKQNIDNVTVGYVDEGIVTIGADITVNANAAIYAGGLCGAGANIYDSVVILKIEIKNSINVTLGGAAGSASGVESTIATFEGLEIIATNAKVGGLVGNALGGVSGEVTSTEDINITAATIYFGGLVGDTTAAISGSFDTENIISIDGLTIVYVGGIAGNSTSSVEGEVNASDFYIDALTVYFGGIAGKTTAEAKGDVRANNIFLEASTAGFAGGVAGYAASVKEADVVIKLLKVISDAYIGGIVGQATHSVKDSTADIVIKNIINTKIKAGYIGGIAGKIGSNVEAVIDNCNANIQIEGESRLDGNYFAGGIAGSSAADITKSSASGKINITSSKTNDFAGGATVYAGGIAGQTNYTKAGQITIGLISDCNADVELEDIKSVGNALGTVYAGGIAGQNRGVIEKSYAKGKIAAFALKNLYVGGLVGSNEIVSNSPALINNTYTLTGTLKIDMSDSGEKGYLGGLVGYNGGTINNSYAKAVLKGSATGSNKELNVGGFAGVNAAVIEKCFALNVLRISIDVGVLDNATVYAGGFVGGNIGSAANKLATIINAHTTVNVAADAYTGGFAGFNNGFGTITYAISLGEVNNAIGGTKVGGFAAKGLTGYSKCYYSIDAAGDIEKVGEGNVEDSMVLGKSDYDLCNKFIYEAAAFDSGIWLIDDKSIPTLILDKEIWENSVNGPVFKK